MPKGKKYINIIFSNLIWGTKIQCFFHHQRWELENFIDRLFLLKTFVCCSSIIIFIRETNFNETNLHGPKIKQGDRVSNLVSNILYIFQHTSDIHYDTRFLDLFQELFHSNSKQFIESILSYVWHLNNENWRSRKIIIAGVLSNRHSKKLRLLKQKINTTKQCYLFINNSRITWKIN